MLPGDFHMGYDGSSTLSTDICLSAWREGKNQNLDVIVSCNESISH
jgi:hypothetical protein